MTHSYLQWIDLYTIKNLQVTTFILLDGPAPTPLWALTCNTYTVSGDNPSIVHISSLLFKLLISVPLSWMEYCVMTPLGSSGGIHWKVKELEATETISNEWGSLGPKIKHKNHSIRRNRKWSWKHSYILDHWYTTRARVSWQLSAAYIAVKF